MTDNPKSTAHSRALKRLLVISLIFVVLAIAAIFTPLLINKVDVQVALRPLTQIGSAFFYSFAEPFSLTSVVIGVSVTLLYLSILLLLFGLIGAAVGKNKGHIAGAFTIALDLCAIALGSHYFYEFFKGDAAGTIPSYWCFILLGIVGVIFLFFAVTVMTLFAGNGKEALVKEESATQAKEEEKGSVSEEKKEETVFVQAEKEETKKEEEPIHEEKKEDPIREEKEEEKPNETDPFAAMGERKKRVPFDKKVKQAEKDTRDHYKAIVAALAEYGFSDRLSAAGHSFSYKRKKLVYITFAGKTLKVHFALDPKQFEGTPIPVKDASQTKRFEDVPSFLKVKSNLAEKRAIELAKRVAKEHQVPLAKK